MFEGFSDATVDFMWGIRFNNERSWFEAHKSEYLTHFQAPMRALAEEVCLPLEDKYAKQGFIHKVSRIYRDARRLHGRGPYKDHLWFSLEKPREHWTSAPSFWFELAPEGAQWGFGYWTRPVVAAKLRARMDADPKPMEKLTRRLQTRPDLALRGEEYKHPKGEPASELLRPWYQKKYYSITHEEKIGASLYTHELAGRVRADFEFLMPFYEYFSTLEGDPEPDRL